LSSAGRDGRPSREARPSVCGAFPALLDYELT